MQAAAAVVARSHLNSVLRGAAFAAGLAARAAVRAAEGFARTQALLYVTREITLADILLYATATFEDVPPEPPAPRPHIDERAAVVGMAVIVGAVLVGMSISDDAVADQPSRTRKKQRCCHPYALALTRRCCGTSSYHEEAPATAPAAPPPRRAIETFPPPLRRVAAPFDASRARAIAAWLHE